MGGYQVIARKYRPTTFDEVVGQGAVARTLRNAIEADRVAHAYMFCGPRGVGKTSMARILARALNCLESDAPTPEPCGACSLCVAAAVGEDLDVFEMDAASNRKVDDARNLIANVSFRPTRARFKIYIVDEVHMLTTEAFNALLKTLEEPPSHVKFVFATTDPQKVPATILSRCQRFDFRPVPAADIAVLLAKIAAAEGHEADEQALLAIARASEGGVRDAELLMEQLATLGGGQVRLPDLHALLGTVSAERMRSLFHAVSQGDVAGVLDIASQVLDAGTDAGELLRQCMRHAHDLMLVKVQGQRAAGVVADDETRRALSEQAERMSDATLAYSVTLFSEALKNARLLGEGRLFAETALARLAGHRDMRYLDQLVRDLSRLEKRLDGAPPPASGASAATTSRPRATPPAPSELETPESGMPESGIPESGISESGISESGISESGISESGISESGISESGLPEFGTPKSGTAALGTPTGEPPGSARPRSGISRPEHASDSASVVSSGPDAPQAAAGNGNGNGNGSASGGTADPGVLGDVAPGQASPGQVSPGQVSPGQVSMAVAIAPVLDAAGLQARWSEVREAARAISSRLGAHLEPARIEALDDDALVLSYPPSGAFHRSAIEDRDLAEHLGTALESVVGRHLRVRTVEREGAAEDVQHEPAERQRRRGPAGLSAAEQEAVRSAPLSKLIERELGGRIIHIERDS